MAFQQITVYKGININFDDSEGVFFADIDGERSKSGTLAGIKGAIDRYSKLTVDRIPVYAERGYDSGLFVKGFVTCEVADYDRQDGKVYAAWVVYEKGSREKLYLNQIYIRDKAADAIVAEMDSLENQIKKLTSKSTRLKKKLREYKPIHNPKKPAAEE